MKDYQYNFIMAYLSLIMAMVSTFTVMWGCLAGFWAFVGIINTLIDLKR